MTRRLLAGFVFVTGACVVSGAPVPAANLLAQIAAADVIVTGVVQRVEMVGRGSTNAATGVIAGNVMVAEMSVDQVLKGAAASSIRIRFLIPDVPNGYQGLQRDTYRAVFLRGGAGEYQLASPFHPSTAAMAGPPLSGATPADRVIAAVSRVASAESVARQRRVEALFALWGISHQTAREAVGRALTATDVEVRVTGAAVMLSADVLDEWPIAEAGANSYRLLAALLGVMRAGGVVVPIHERSTAEQALPHLRVTQPRCLFYDRSRSAEVRRLQQELPSLRLCVCLDGAWESDPGLDDLLRGDDRYAESWIDVSGNPDRPVYYWATSGTTGEPKVVIETIRTFNIAIHAARTRRSGWVNVFLSMAPMSHGGGPAAFTTLVLGGTVIIPRNVAPATVLAAIQAERVTELWLSPTALYLMLDFPKRGAFDASTVKCFLMGMAGVSPDRVRAAVEAFGPCIAHTYGQIETGIVTVLDAATVADSVRGVGPERLLSSGRNAGINRFAIMDDDGQLLGAGAEGEIVVRGSTVKRYMDEVSTAAAQAGGWHRTGDVGYVDEAGYLYVVGRKRDVINVGGLKVAAADVERIIMELEEVRECAVVAVPDALRGEAIKAIVVAASGATIETDRIVQHCLTRLGVGRAPHSVDAWSELPRSPVGKIDKQQIRDRLSR